MARIVICDDSKATTLGLKIKLQQAGHEIVGSASDGNEGIDVYRRVMPDIMLLDITMPNMDGKECLELIIKEFPEANIIMISGVQVQTVIQQCLQMGAKGYFNKSKLFDEEYLNAEILPTIVRILKPA